MRSYDDITEYRDKIEQGRTQRRDVERFKDGGRRETDYIGPNFVTKGFLITLAVLVSVALILLTGCNTVHRLTSSPASLPDIYIVSGVTSVDYQIIQPIRCADSVISVKVKRPSETKFTALNNYEYTVILVGAGGGGIKFNRQVITGNNGVLYITGGPAAPTGTQYEITSVLVLHILE